MTTRARASKRASATGNGRAAGHAAAGPDPTDPAPTPPTDVGGPDVPAILQHAVDEAVRLLEADGALIGLLDDERHLRFAYESGISESRVQRWRTTVEAASTEGRGMIGSAIAENRVLFTGDYPVEQSFSHSERGDRLAAELGIRSLVAAPLTDGDRAIGVLAVYSGREDAFAERDVALARALADHAAGTIATAGLIGRLAESEAALARRVEIQRTLASVGSGLAALRDPPAVLQASVDAAARLLDADGALLDLIDPERGTISWAYDSGIEDESIRDILRALELRVGEGMFGRAIESREVVVTGDYLADERFVHAEGSDQFARRIGVGSMIVAPLIAEEGPMGVLGIYTRRTDAFGEDDMALTRTFATQATIALTNARLIAELETSRTTVARHAEAERTLREIAARITGVRDPEEVVQLSVDAATRLLDADGARIDLISADRRLLRAAYISGEAPTEEEWPDDPDETLDQGVGGRAVVLGGPFRTDDYLRDERFDHGSSADHYVRVKGIASALAAPLVGDSGPFGAITVWSGRTAAFGEPDEALLVALATQATIALTNAGLIADLERSRTALAERADSERTLRELAARLTAIRAPRELLTYVVAESSRLLEADRAQLDIVGRDGMLHLFGETDIDDPGTLMGEAGSLTPAGPDVGINSLAIAARGPVSTSDYLSDERFPHLEESDDYVRCGRHRLGPGRPAHRRRCRPRRPQGQLEAVRRLQRRRRRAAPRDRPPGGRRPRQQPPHRGSRPLPRRPRAPCRRGAGAARDLGPPHRHPRPRRGPPAGRRRGRPSPRRGRRPHRSHRPGQRRDPLGLCDPRHRRRRGRARPSATPSRARAWPASSSRRGGRSTPAIISATTASSGRPRSRIPRACRGSSRCWRCRSSATAGRSEPSACSRRPATRSTRGTSCSSTALPSRPAWPSPTPGSSTSWPVHGRPSDARSRPSTPCARSPPGSPPSTTRGVSSSGRSTRRSGS